MNVKQYNYKAIVSISVFIIVLFNSVAPAIVFSFDFNTEEVIFNSVITSSNTGGKSGVDGKDGVAGQSGENGRAGGQDGISVVTSSSSASVHVRSSADGEKVVDVYKQVSGNGVDAISYTLATSTDFAFAVKGELTDESDGHLTQESLSNLEKVLLSIQLILLKYVSILF